MNSVQYYGLYCKVNLKQLEHNIWSNTFIQLFYYIYYWIFVILYRNEDKMKRNLWKLNISKSKYCILMFKDIFKPNFELSVLRAKGEWVILDFAVLILSFTTHQVQVNF